MVQRRRRLLLAATPLVLIAAGWAAKKPALAWYWSKAPDAFHILYHRQGAQTFNNTYWLGTPVQKTPLDLWVYQEILTELRADLIIETGTYKGGSALFLASVCDLLGTGEVATVDIEEYPNLPKHSRIRYLHGSSTAPEIVEQFKSLAAGKRTVVVFLDSAHTKDHVLNELRLYSPLVTKGSYLVVEDTHFNGHPILPHHGPGPMEAVNEFLKENGDFAVDASREKFLMTFNPRGYLRKARQ